MSSAPQRQSDADVARGSAPDCAPASGEAVGQDSDSAPLIAHVIYRFDVGGLENGLVNLINRMPEGRYRHAIVALTESTEFRRRLRNQVPVYELHKRPGQDLGLYVRLWRLFRSLRPDIVHTRNLATLEAQLPAFLAGVPYRVHGEHGRDMHDLDNRSRKYRLLRRLFRPLVQRYIPLSGELARYLRDDVRVRDAKLRQIINGVDTGRFRPAQSSDRQAVLGAWAAGDDIVIGSVGRMEPVKDPLNLVEAFAELVAEFGAGGRGFKLLMIGDGSLRGQVEERVERLGLRSSVWLTGARDDVANLLRAMDVFVLPSRAEGISNTVLEAMASGLPVVATDVGGNRELLQEGKTGFLVPREDPEALAAAMARYSESPELRVQHGRAGLDRAERLFSMDRMVEKYLEVYDECLADALR